MGLEWNETSKEEYMFRGLADAPSGFLSDTRLLIGFHKGKGSPLTRRLLNCSSVVLIPRVGGSLNPAWLHLKINGIAREVWQTRVDRSFT